MELIYGAIGLLIGAVVVFFIGSAQRKKLQNAVQKQDNSHKLEAEKILSDAKLKAEKTFQEYKEKQEAFKQQKIQSS